MCHPAYAMAWHMQGPLEHVYRAALALGTANQLTNILRDVGEDASQRNRIYVPLEDLAAFKIREEEVRGGTEARRRAGRLLAVAV